MEKDTIFGKIINREIPATIIYEDAESLAFFDINPVTKGHTLLIPKTPYGRMQDVPDEIVAALFVTTKKIMRCLIAGLSCDFVQVVVEGKDIPDHFHIHLIPRFEHEDVATWHHTTYTSPEEMNGFAEKIKKGI